MKTFCSPALQISSRLHLFVACELVFLLGVQQPIAVGGELSDVATVNDHTSHRASSYDRTGGNIDTLTSFAPKTSRLLMESDGPGRINHIWMTIAVFPNHMMALRDVVVRMYWENSELPSVEVPLGDFFGLAGGRRYRVQSAPISVGDNTKALNCYWPMPFYKHARVELYNRGPRSIRRLYYHVDYELGELPGNQGLFHAKFRRDRALGGQSSSGNISGKDNFVALDTVGQGQYLGCMLSIDAHTERWCEGDDMIFIDGSDMPTLIGTGTEDYFCNAWGFNEAYSYPYYGAPFLERRPDKLFIAVMYRWHIPDPIRFRESIRVTFEHLYPKNITADYTSVAYWYQREPIESRAPLPDNNYPQDYQPAPITAEDLDTTELEPELLARGIAAQAITSEIHDGYTDGGYLKIDTKGKPVEIPLAVREPGTYRVLIKPVGHLNDGSMRIAIKGGVFKPIPKRDVPEANVPYINIGTIEAQDRAAVIVVGGDAVVGLDQIKMEKVGTPASKPAG